MSKSKQLLVTMVCFLSLTLPAVAGPAIVSPTTDQGKVNSTAPASIAWTAFRLKDYVSAFRNASAAAQTGDISAIYLMAVMYEQGLGTAANPDEAAQWYARTAHEGISTIETQLSKRYAQKVGESRDMGQRIGNARRPDRAGDPEGRFMRYLALRTGPLSQADSSGKFDIGKYNALSIRPIKGRVQDVDARDSLYRSAALGLPQAQQMLALTLGATVGDSNRERMFALAGTVPGRESPLLQVYAAIAQREKKLGRTYASPQLFLDVQSSQLPVGAVLTCGFQRPEATGHAVQLVHTSIALPPEGSVFLPTHEAGYGRAYLVAGKWVENWTYEGCGRRANVAVQFTADGMGSAFVESTTAVSPRAGATE